MHAFVVPEDVLRAVAVVDVEIDDGDALGAMRGLRVARGDRRVVEEAEAHRGRDFGVVAGRPRRDEGVVRPCRDITSSTANAAPPAARSAASQVPGDIACPGRSRTRPCAGRRRSMASTYSAGCTRVSAPSRRARRDSRASIWNASASSARSTARIAVGPLGVAFAHVVLEAGGMGDEKRGHRAILPR